MNDDYAGNWTFKSGSGNVVRQHFVTQGGQRFVIDSRNPAEDCHRESTGQLFEDLKGDLIGVPTDQSSVSSCVGVQVRLNIVQQRTSAEIATCKVMKCFFSGSVQG